MWFRFNILLFCSHHCPAAHSNFLSKLFPWCPFSQPSEMPFPGTKPVNVKNQTKRHPHKKNCQRQKRNQATQKTQTSQRKNQTLHRQKPNRTTSKTKSEVSFETEVSQPRVWPVNPLGCVCSLHIECRDTLLRTIE